MYVWSPSVRRSFSFLFISFGLLLQEGFGLLARRRFVNLTWVAFVGGIELFAVGMATFADALAGRFKEIS